MAEKSFFATLLNFITGNADRKKINDISAQQAILLQKDYIKNLNQKKIELCSPPYIEISKQLTNKKSEIFRAVVYYLNEIAKNEAQYKAPIISILRHYKENTKRSKEDIQYLDFYLKQLEK